MDMNKVDEYKALLKEKLSERRYTHCLNVSKEAVKFAKKYGADEKKAEVAGLLHDITKEMPFDEQLKIIENGGIILNACEKSAQKLWHAISGMVYIRDFIGIDDEDILNAVRYHTTARANMSVLEKVIFLADFTSAERDYPDVDVIRAKSEISLEEGMLYGLSFTIKRLIDQGRIVSLDAVMAYNEILQNR